MYRSQFIEKRIKLEGRVIPLTPDDLRKGKNVHDVVLYIDGKEVATYDGVVTKTSLALLGLPLEEDETVHFCMKQFIESKGWTSPGMGLKLMTYIWSVTYQEERGQENERND